jgi:chromosome segregation ATPase
VTHGPSEAGSDGVEVELAALRGRVVMVEAELVAARATRDQLAAEFERLRVDNQRLRARVGELAAQVEQLRPAELAVLSLTGLMPAGRPSPAADSHGRLGWP